jgi:glycosyltransferase involved in cell wall biosynthesis
MKILVIQDHLRSGGTERQSVLLARAAAAAGHQSSLLTFRPGGALAAPDGVDRRSLQPFDLGLDWFAPGLFRSVRRIRPDVSVCMGRMANCYAGILQSRFPEMPVIATLRTGKPVPLLYRRSLRTVRHVVANSREAGNLAVARLSVPGDRISVIANALVFPPGPPAARDPAIRARAGAGAGTFVMLCVAMFRPGKNQAELVEIAAGLPRGSDWQLWLAGEGSERARCERLAASLGVAPRVKFLGYCADPSPLYAGADAAVLASRSESLSNFLIEAQARGLPAVATEALGVSECFLPGRTGWAVAPGDRGAFREALLRLMAEPAGRRSILAAEAAAFARAAFDPATQTAAYFGLFERLRSP